MASLWHQGRSRIDRQFAYIKLDKNLKMMSQENSLKTGGLKMHTDMADMGYATVNCRSLG